MSREWYLQKGANRRIDCCSPGVRIDRIDRVVQAGVLDEVLKITVRAAAPCLLGVEVSI